MSGEEFPLSCVDWYRLRDDRTTRGEPNPRLVVEPIVVAVPAPGDTLAGVACRTFLNLVARFARDVTLVPSSRRVSYPEWEKVARGWVELMTRVDPCGQFKLRDSHECPVADVGYIEADGEDVAVKALVRPFGWGAQVSQKAAPRSSTSPDPNPLGYAIASCLAAREAFIAAVNSRMPTRARRDWELDPFRISPGGDPEFPTKPDLGRILVVGTGGVGANFVEFLLETGIRAEATLVDYDVVSYTDLNRCLPFFWEDVTGFATKVSALARACQGTSVRVHPFEGNYSSFVGTQGRGDFDQVFVLANEGRVPWAIQNNLPPLTWSAATSQNWGLLVSRHIPLRDACVACLWGMHESEAPTLACSTARVRSDSEAVLRSLPFLSPLASALLLANAIRLTVDSSVTEASLITGDMEPNPPRLFHTELIPRGDCLCRTVPSGVYRRFLVGSRFESLSQ